MIILDELKTKKRVVNKELADFLQVSCNTIRQDIKDLARVNRLTIVHGGALPIEPNSVR
ncbi:DeoR family transcriptional regulator [Niabella ginsenosidivorans]